MRRLASSAAELKPRYEVVVIGSGYGGAVMAARLAQAGFEVCLLERGAERHPGEYPSTPAELAASSQLELRGRRIGRTDAMFRFLIDEHHGAVVGCGLGGTSLINAGIVLRPPREIWSEPRWPVGLRGDLDRLDAAFDRAERELQPATPPATARSHVLREAADARGDTLSHVPLAVNLGADASRPSCTGCGNCITGCNHGAKNTLLVNYLPKAVEAGAALFCSVDVRHLERAADGWRVFLRLAAMDREKFETTELSIDARIVVVAAGAVGSPEVLLRSKQRGLALSEHVGRQWSGNGTIVGFTVGEQPARAERPGPSICTMIDLRRSDEAGRRMVIQDTVLPDAVAPVVAAMLRTRRVSTWSVTAGDDARGVLELEGDALRVRWPGAGDAEPVAAVHEELDDLSRRLGGELRPNPAWSALPGKPLLATHPLGGCSYGEDSTTGVVSHTGQVFDASGPPGAVYRDLYVCDGSTLPGALGTNPLLTLTALAERCAEYFVREHVPLRASVARRRATSAVGLRFTERMEGFLSPSAADGSMHRPPDAQPLSFLLTVEWPDVDALLENPSLPAATIGSVRAPSLSPKPLSVAGGSFQLFVGEGRERRMLHRMPLTGSERALTLEGYKVIRDDPGPDLWFDTRTLFVAVRDGDAVLARGAVQTGTLDLLRQVTTIRGVGARDLGADLRARAKFLELFLGTVRDVYGGLVLPLVR